MGQVVEDWEVFSGKRLVATSGGFDPLHVGHLRCFQESAKIAQANECELVVIVNGDGWLKRKKGFSFMSSSERVEIVAGIAGVDYVVEWDDGGPTVTGALERLRPRFFTKGGDRTQGGDFEDYRSSNVPEFRLCSEIGCEVVFGVGGGKVQSSSSLTGQLPREWRGSHKEKPWGFEVWWTPHEEESSTPYAGKILHIEPGKRLSLQYHKKKEETVLVLSGELIVEGSHPARLSPGQVFHVSPGQLHRFGAAGNSSCTLVEVSTKDLYDVVRVEDDHGRVDG